MQSNVSDPEKSWRFRVARAFAVTFAVFIAPASAWADVTPPCTELDGCLACSPGTSCPSGTTCASVQCGLSPTVLSKCIHCPTVIAGTPTQCNGPGPVGQACADGGTCSVVPPECRSLPGYGYTSCLAFGAAYEPVCAPQDSGTFVDASEAGSFGAADAGSFDAALSPLDAGGSADGGRASAAGPGASGGGCAASPARDGEGILAALLGLCGLAALLVERRRAR
jgi:hypothetical protein